MTSVAAASRPVASESGVQAVIGERRARRAASVETSTAVILWEHGGPTCSGSSQAKWGGRGPPNFVARSGWIGKGIVVTPAAATLRPKPQSAAQEVIEALKAQFQDRVVTSVAVREQHGN